MNKILTYIERINKISNLKRSFTILALDLESRYHNVKYIQDMIRNLYPYLCGIKMNFHLLLSFSKKDIADINKFAHSYGLQSIADIKLNDIKSTNHVTIRHLHSMYFDSVIVNPIIGKSGLSSLVKFAHKFRMGVISLAYMSHEYVSESYGLNVIIENRINKHKILPLFEIFLQYAKKSNVDGIIVGATHLKILKYISTNSDISIYSPGIGIQGGNAKLAIKNGSSYLIIGRSILRSKNKRKILSSLIDFKKL